MHMTSFSCCLAGPFVMRWPHSFLAKSSVKNKLHSLKKLLDIHCDFLACNIQVQRIKQLLQPRAAAAAASDKGKVVSKMLRDKGH